MNDNAQDEYLVCPHHGKDRVRLVVQLEFDWMVECLRCGYQCQNFLKYPVAEVFNSTTRQTYLKNVLTGEIVEPEKEEI